MDDLISKRDAIEAVNDALAEYIPTFRPWQERIPLECALKIKALPAVQPEYKPVTAEELAKTMSKNTIFAFAAWHGEALALMKEYGFVICKKTM